MDAKPKRTCFNCRNYSLCWLRVSIDHAIKEVGLLNFDHDGKTPGRPTDIFFGVANACLEFKPEDTNE